MSTPARPVQPENADFIEIDLRQYLALLRKWRWVIALITAAAVAASAFLSYFVLAPVYQAEVLLRVADSSGQRVVPTGNGLEAVVDTVSQLPQISINTYVQQLTSEAMQRRVADRLEAEGGDRVLGVVRAAPVRDTNLVSLTVEHTDPVHAARVANLFSEEFLLFLSQQSQEQMAKSLSFLQEQVTRVKAELDEATEALRGLEAQPRSQAILQERLDAANRAVTEAKMQRAQAEVELAGLEASVALLQEQLARTPEMLVMEESIRTGDGDASTATGTAGSGGQAAVSEPPAWLQREETEAGAGGTPAPDDGAAAAPESTPATQPQWIRRQEINPAYTALRQELDAKLLQIAGARARLTALASQEAAAEAEVSRYQQELAAQKAGERELRARVEQLEQTYQTLNANLTETQVAQSLELGEIAVVTVSPAATPVDPVKPNKQLNMAVAGVLGLMIAVVLSFLLEYLDSTVKRPEDIERHLGALTLGTVPRIADGK